MGAAAASSDVSGFMLATGAQQFVLNIPSSISLNGVQLFEQLAAFTPGANPFGVLMSPTMRIRLSAK